MTRFARRRNALLWLVLGPAILIALVVSIRARPPVAISDGPVPVVEDTDSAKPPAANPGTETVESGATP